MRHRPLTLLLSIFQIFGATGHIGRSIVKAALAHGDLVTAVGRMGENTVEGMVRAFWHPPPAARPPQEGGLGEDKGDNSVRTTQPRDLVCLLCDVRVQDTVKTVFDKSLERWGRMDIIANCSGYGVIGACEDQDEFEVRNQFETNFWGVLNILQLSLPYFRTKPSRHEEGQGGIEEDGNLVGGRYLIFSSTSGSLGVPGLGPYCATKYAVEGLVESMLYETAAFNVRATLVEPGHVRRDDPPASTVSGAEKNGNGTLNSNTKLDANNHASHAIENLKPKPKNDLPTYGHFSLLPVSSTPYASPTSPANHARRTVQWLGERQPTSAVKSAELIWQLGHCRFPVRLQGSPQNCRCHPRKWLTCNVSTQPLRLLLGAFAVESVRDRLRCVIEEIEDWRGLRFPRLEDGGEETWRRGRSEEEEEDEDEDERTMEAKDDEEVMLDENDVKMEKDGGRG